MDFVPHEKIPLIYIHDPIATAARLLILLSVAVEMFYRSRYQYGSQEK